MRNTIQSFLRALQDKIYGEEYIYKTTWYKITIQHYGDINSKLMLFRCEGSRRVSLEAHIQTYIFNLRCIACLLWREVMGVIGITLNLIFHYSNMLNKSIQRMAYNFILSLYLRTNDFDNRKIKFYS